MRENFYNSTAFGVTSAISESVVQPFRFTAREWDAETGRYYLRARNLDPILKSFTSEDPIRFASGDVNWYRYVGNDPINFVDPLGLFLIVYPANNPGKNLPGRPTTSRQYAYAIDSKTGTFYEIYKCNNGILVAYHKKSGMTFMLVKNGNKYELGKWIDLGIEKSVEGLRDFSKQSADAESERICGGKDKCVDFRPVYWNEL